jgi:hypothetical protein
MRCPGATDAPCGGILAPIALGGTPAHGCETCGGAWITEAHLLAAVDHAAPDSAWLDSVLPGPLAGVPGRCTCPSCGGRMSAFAWGETGVVVDACPTCRAAWLEAGELDTLARRQEDLAASLPAGAVARALVVEAVTDRPAFHRVAEVSALVRTLGRRLFLEVPLLAAASGVGETHG